MDTTIARNKDQRTVRFELMRPRKKGIAPTRGAWIPGQECITRMGATPWDCPECRTEQQQRPEQMPRNFFLERRMNSFIESKKNICATHNLPNTELEQQQEIAAEVGELKIRLEKTQQEKSNLEKRINELQSILNSETRDKSSLTKELNKIKEANSNLKIENEKLAKDLKDVTLSRSEADGERKRLEEILQETQTRLQEAERVKAKETVRIKQMNATKQIIVCTRFDKRGKNFRISACRRSVKGDNRWSSHPGFCYLKHPKLRENQILQWTLRVPSRKVRRGTIGKVITVE